MPLKAKYTEPEENLFREWIKKRAFETLDTEHSSAIEQEWPWGVLRGFVTRAQRLDPTLPIAPLNVNIHQYSADTRRSGPLTQEDVARSAECLDALTKRVKLDRHDAIVGMPFSGDPFARSLALITDKKLIRMTKISRENVYCLIRNNLPLGARRVLIVDNVVRRGDSISELLWVLRDAGAKVVGVVTLLDWQLGASDRLLSADCKLHALFQLRPLLAFAQSDGIIKMETYRRIVDYLDFCHHQL